LFIICLDSLLLLLFILLLSPRLTGLKIHELLGVLLFVPIVIHLLLAWAWIATTSKRIFARAGSRTRINYFLNATLFVLIMIEIISGLAISQVALPIVGIKTINDRAWRALHNQTLNFTMLFVGLHIAINWKWIVGALRQRLNRPNKNSQRPGPTANKIFASLWRISLILAAAGMVVLTLYGLIGQPSLARLYHQDEIARFRPRIDHGLIQMAGETFLVGLVAYVAHRWLRVRL
jgi:hypothetical protein